MAVASRWICSFHGAASDQGGSRGDGRGDHRPAPPRRDRVGLAVPGRATRERVRYSGVVLRLAACLWRARRSRRARRPRRGRRPAGRRAPGPDQAGAAEGRSGSAAPTSPITFTRSPRGRRRSRRWLQPPAPGSAPRSRAGARSSWTTWTRMLFGGGRWRRPLPCRSRPSPTARQLCRTSSHRAPGRRIWPPAAATSAASSVGSCARSSANTRSASVGPRPPRSWRATWRRSSACTTRAGSPEAARARQARRHGSSTRTSARQRWNEVGCACG